MVEHPTHCKPQHPSLHAHFLLFLVVHLSAPVLVVLLLPPGHGCRLSRALGSQPLAARRVRPQLLLVAGAWFPGGGGDMWVRMVVDCDIHRQSR